MFRRACLIFVLPVLLSPLSALAQEPAPAPATDPLPDTLADTLSARAPERSDRASRERDDAPDFASPFLQPGHWVVDAVRRLYALGLVDAGYDRATRTPTRREVALALEEAVRRAREDAEAYVALAEGYRDRFAEEYPNTMAEVTDEVGAGLRLGDGQALGGLEVGRGRVLPGAGYTDENWTGPTALEDEASPAGAALWSVQYFPAVAVAVAPAWDTDGWSLGDGYATAVWRSAGVWLGRRPIGSSAGAGGGVVLDGALPFVGGGLYLADPVILPGFLRHLGPLRFETFLSRVDGSGPVARPWFWGARAVIDPHPRLELGITRAAMFGGEGENRMSVKNLAYLIVGKHAGDGSQFDNQIFAIDLWYRLPLGGLPLAAYVEWGFEDSSGAWRDTPGIVTGLELPAVPGLPSVALGLERASFSESCCGNPIWYRHWWFEGGWTDGGEPLGHPLGGDGSEWLLWTVTEMAQARVRLSGELFRRERGSENLFSPDRAGTSVGGTVGIEFRPVPRFDVVLRGAHESGDGGWSESNAFAGIRLFF